VVFKEADVIGNPALIALPRGLVLLPSTSIPMNPYFQSMADSLLWRGFMPQAAAEETASIVLENLHHVGTGFSDWGGVYPHEGTVMNIDDLKASMVIAQRATDLLTNAKSLGHIHQTLMTQCGQHCQSSPIQENSKETLFQMVYPIEQTSCSALGSDESYDESMHTEEGAYVWVVWRHYKGCEDGDGKYIGEV
jgi:integrating conjugative element protein (TIGR03756 family)